jgi:hypothetical protein
MTTNNIPPLTVRPDEKIADCQNILEVTKNRGLDLKHSNPSKVWESFLKKSYIQSLARNFKEAVLAGDFPVIQTICHLNDFNKIPTKDLCNAFLVASRIQHSKIMQTLIQSNRFNDISIGDQGTVLFTAAFHNSFEMVEPLINSGRFEDYLKNISSERLGLILYVSAELGALQFVQALITSNQFHRISDSDFLETVRLAFNNNQLVILKALIESGRIISTNDLDDLYYRASKVKQYYLNKWIKK